MSQLKWYACEIHCHTKNSDGEFTVLGLTKAARERKIDGICLTDHNTQSGLCQTDKTVVPVLPGVEWTTFYGHMLVLDCKKELDWRKCNLDNIDDMISQIKDNNGLVGIAHPYQLGTPICTGGHWDFEINDWSKIDFIEIWSDGKPFLNAANSRAIKLWHSRLDEGYHISPTFGRDWHKVRDNSFISACTYLGIENSIVTPSEMKKAIMNGRISVSAGPLFYMKTQDDNYSGDLIAQGEIELEFVIDMNRMKKVADRNLIIPKKIRLVTNNEETVFTLDVEGKCQKAKVLLRKGHWYSAELWGQENEKEHTLLAVTAPIYIKDLKDE